MKKTKYGHQFHEQTPDNSKRNYLFFCVQQNVIAALWNCERHNELCNNFHLFIKTSAKHFLMRTQIRPSVESLSKKVSNDKKLFGIHFFSPLICLLLFWAPARINK